METSTHSNSEWCRDLYDRRAAGLILYGRALGLSHGEAEDVLHETFVALLAMTQTPSRPDHYSIRAFRNRALNHRRSLLRRITRELESRHWFEARVTDDSEERRAMRRLAELPMEQREVIVLKIWHEHTFEEIGAIIGISPNTAAGRYRYGIQKLKIHLSPHEQQRNPAIGTTRPVVDAPVAFDPHTAWALR